MFSFIPIGVASVIAVLSQAAPESTALHHTDAAFGECSHCHEDAQPKVGSATLKPCTRPTPGASPGQAASAPPDVFLLDQLSEMYVPVVFPHKLHAGMTAMGDGCNVCHHRNPPGPVLPCARCHGGSSNPETLRQPGLKGAYHRQCLGCHREWTHDTDCVVCHAKREPGAVVTLPKDGTDIMGLLHPNIEVPDRRIYQTPKVEATPVVTFHHKDHVELFRLQCVDCHQHESCSRCHDSARRAPHVRSDPHEDCIRCHQQEVNDDCAYCHAEKERGAFEHAARTGFDLTKWHSAIPCRQCHGTETRFTRPKTECTVCHAKDWRPKDFDHARTGTALGELHKDLDCGECHPEGFEKPSTCTSCHEQAKEKTSIP